MGNFLKKEVERHVKELLIKHKNRPDGETWITDEMIDKNIQEVFAVNFGYKNGELI